VERPTEEDRRERRTPRMTLLYFDDETGIESIGIDSINVMPKDDG
jgi:hypothetical protein